MEVSKLELSEELQHQTSSLTKILLWMKAHPERCRKTNIKNLAWTIGMDKDRPVQATNASIQTFIVRLIRKGLVIRSGGKHRADFVINYGHPEMPPIVDAGEVRTTYMERGEKVLKRVHRRKRKPSASGLPSSTVLIMNGDTIPNLLVKWFEEHDGEIILKRTDGMKLATAIHNEGKIVAEINSLSAYIGKLVREGKITRVQCGKFYDYSVAKTSESLPTIPAERLKQPTLLEIENYIEETKKDYEERNKPMEEQTVNLPSGGTITLTININLGK